MALEKESYRDNLCSLKEFMDSRYGDDRHMMTVKDVCEYMGRSFDFVKKHFGISKSGITIETFARKLS